MIFTALSSGSLLYARGVQQIININLLPKTQRTDSNTIVTKLQLGIKLHGINMRVLGQ